MVTLNEGYLEGVMTTGKTIVKRMSIQSIQTSNNREQYTDMLIGIYEEHNIQKVKRRKVLHVTLST